MLLYALNIQTHLTQSSIAKFGIVTKDGLFKPSIVTSQELTIDVTQTRDTEVLWRHIRRLFLLAPIAAKLIFTSEKQQLLSIICHT